MAIKKVHIKESDLIDLIHWARRYCDNRATYAANSFNNIYNRIALEHPDLIRAKDLIDETLKEKGKYWPYAQDWNYNDETNVFEARPRTRFK